MAGDSPMMPVRCCSLRRSISRRTVAVTSAGSAGLERYPVRPSRRASPLASGSVCSTRPSVEIERSRARPSSWAAPDSCNPPVTTMQSGAGSRRITWRASSSVCASVVLNPVASRLALMRTACSRSSVVTRIRSLMDRSLPGHQLDRVVEQTLEHGEPILHAAGGARQVHDQRLAAGARHTARQPRAREPPGAGPPQRVGDARREPIEHRFRGFRRHVARGEARSSGREDDVDLTRVRPARELAGNAIGLVGHHASYDHLVPVISGPRDDRVTGRVGALAQRTKVTDGQNPDPHQPPPFSTVYFFVLLGTNGSATTSAAARLPRTSIANPAPGLAWATGRYVIPMAQLTVGVTVPERTTSTCVPSRYTP